MGQTAESRSTPIRGLLPVGLNKNFPLERAGARIITPGALLEAAFLVMDATCNSMTASPAASNLDASPMLW
jgi:hypothetical protein